MKLFHLNNIMHNLAITRLHVIWGGKKNIIYITEINFFHFTFMIYDNENKSMTSQDNFTYKNEDNTVKLQFFFFHFIFS